MKRVRFDVNVGTGTRHHQFMWHGTIELVFGIHISYMNQAINSRPTAENKVQRLLVTSYQVLSSAESNIASSAVMNMFFAVFHIESVSDVKTLSSVYIAG